MPPVRRSRLGWRDRVWSLSLATAVSSAAFVTACAPARPMPISSPAPIAVGAPIPVPEKPVPVDPLAEPWLVGVPTASIAHELVVTTAVRAAETADALTSARADSSRTIMTVRWDSVGLTSARSGAVLSVQVGIPTPDGPSGVPVGLSLPVPLALAFDAARASVRITAPGVSGCGVDAAVAQMAREVLLAPPSRLVRGTSWIDSLRTTICRDSIPLTLTSTRRYVVEDARIHDGRAVAVIRRRSTTTLSGTGSQFGEPVTITGEGQGELLFGLRLDDGQMTHGNGVSTLTLSLTGRRKSQVVTQNARLEIRLKAGS
ncbi:MAG: hypothetical protein ACKOC2_01575 [Gemmatimonadota bacterium]